MSTAKFPTCPIPSGNGEQISGGDQLGPIPRLLRRAPNQIIEEGMAEPLDMVGIYTGVDRIAQRR